MSSEAAVDWRYGRTIDVEVVSERPRVGKAFVLAAIADVIALVCLFGGGGRPLAYAVAGLCHAAAVAPLLLGWDAGPSGCRRFLAVALVATLPLAGAVMAMMTLSVRGRSELAEPMPAADVEASPLDPAVIRRVASALPACEALLAASADERRALIAALTRRADGDAVEVLRWALTAPNGELALEAALALEDISATFEKQLTEMRGEVAAAPSRALAMRAGDLIAKAIHARVVDPTLIGPLYAEARRYYALAQELDPPAALEIATSWAQLELAALKPDAAVDLIDRALAQADGSPADLKWRRELTALRADAVLASHDLPWEGPSAMATYRPALPPPLTAHKLFPSVLRSVTSRQGRTKSDIALARTVTAETVAPETPAADTTTRQTSERATSAAARRAIHGRG